MDHIWHIESNISEYLAAHNDPTESFIALYGPYMANNMEKYGATVNKLCQRSPMMTYIRSISAMDVYFWQAKTYSNYKHAVRQAIEKFQYMHSNSPLLQTFIEWMNEELRVIREQQKERAASESAIIGSSGIGHVYNATLSKGHICTLEQVRLHHGLASCQKYLKEGMYPLDICTRIISDRGKEITRAFTNIPCCDTMPITGPQSLMAMCGKAFENSSKLVFGNDVGAYYFMAAVAFWQIPMTLLVEFLDLYAPSVETVANESLVTRAESFLPLVTEAIESLEEEYLDTNQMEEQSEQQISKLLENMNLKRMEPTQDLDKFISYLHLHREYKCNQFTNQMFLQENGEALFDRYILKDDAIIVTLEDGTLLCPFTNIATDWSLHLLAMDISGDFFIINGLSWSGKHPVE